MNGKKYAPIVLRLGIALVFIWFGTQQLLNTKDWVGWLPSFATSLPLKATTLVIMNGFFETIVGLALGVGLFVRISAVLLALHLASIVLTVGYNDIGVRDFGLLIATISIALQGADDWSLLKKSNES